MEELMKIIEDFFAAIKRIINSFLGFIVENFFAQLKDFVNRILAMFNLDPIE